MKTLRELLQEADPLRSESESWRVEDRDRRRKSLLAAAKHQASSVTQVRRRISLIFTAALMVITAGLVGGLGWTLFNSNLQAAVRFEVRLAEDKPAPGLHEAKVSGSERLVYLHEDVVVSNSDIASATVIPGRSPSQYGVSIEFTPAGAARIRAATANHLGKPVAILIDGQIVMAPTVKSPIDRSAVISGTYTKAEAERIVKGVAIK